MSLRLDPTDPEDMTPAGRCDELTSVFACGALCYLAYCRIVWPSRTLQHRMISHSSLLLSGYPCR